MTDNSQSETTPLTLDDVRDELAKEMAKFHANMPSDLTERVVALETEKADAPAMPDISGELEDIRQTLIRVADRLSQIEKFNTRIKARYFGHETT